VVIEKYKTNLMLLNLHNSTKLYNNRIRLETYNKIFSNDIMQKTKLQALNCYTDIFTGHNNMLDNILYTISPTQHRNCTLDLQDGHFGS